MEVGEREVGICYQHFYHSECGCPCHRAPLPVVALLRGAPHEATAKGVGVLTHRGRHGLRCPTHALVTSVSGGIIIHTTGKPRTRRRLPCADHHADERVLLLHRIVLGGPCPASATWCQVVGSINPPATRSTQSRSISSTSAPRSELDRIPELVGEIERLQAMLGRGSLMRSDMARPHPGSAPCRR